MARKRPSPNLIIGSHYCKSNNNLRRYLLKALVEEGLVKNIGLSNFSCQGIRDVISYANIKPAALQVEIHPYLQQGRT